MGNINQNLLKIYPSLLEDQTLNYKDGGFSNLLSQTKADEQSNEKQLISRLEEIQKQFKERELIFYNFYGATSYPDFQKKIYKQLETMNSDGFIDDFKRVTTRSIVDNAILEKAISARLDKTAQEYAYLPKEQADVLLQAFLSQLSPIIGDELTPLGKEIVAGSGVGWSKKDLEKQVKGASVEHEKILKKYFTNISNKAQEEVLEVLNEFLKRRKTREKMNIVGQSGTLAKNMIEEIVKIYNKKAEEIGDLSFVLETGETVVFSYPFKLNKVPTKAIKEAISKSGAFDIAFDASINYDNVINPVPAERLKAKQELARLIESDPEKWKKKSKDPSAWMELLNVGDLNLEIKNWCMSQGKYSSTGLGLKSKTFSDYFDATITADPRHFIREFSNPSKLIGLIGEDFSLLFFRTLRGKQNFSATVTGIGGTIKGREKENISLLDEFRAKKQPPVDTLVKFYSEMLGKNYDVGIQVKHSYQSDVKTSHSVEFIASKSIDKVFNQDLLGLFMKQVDTSSGAKLEELQYSDFVQNFIPLLQAYFGNTTIQAILKEKFSGESTDKRKKTSLKSIDTAIDIVNKIFSYFIELSLDFGEYESAIENNNQNKLKERNLFLLYANEFFIPASEIIQWSLDAIKSNEAVFSVRNTSDPEILLKNLTGKNEPFNVQSDSNFTENIKMAGNLILRYNTVNKYNLLGI